MGDYDRDRGAIEKSCNISIRNNIVAPKLGLKSSHVWNYFDKPLAPSMTSFNGLSEIVSLDFPIARQDRSYDQVIITNQNNNEQLYLHTIQSVQFIQQTVVPQSRTMVACVPPITTPQKCIDLQQQPDIRANIHPNLTFSMKTPLTQSRTRNYYKCSTSKHCEAKKQIEKSPKDENIFVVSCSGGHNHDPPMNRRYLASCNNDSKFKIPKGINSLPKASILNASSSSSMRIKHSRVVTSPIIATKPTLEIGSKNKMVVAVVQNKGDDNIKVNMTEDIFMGIDQLQRATTST
uniref:WRKY domain-containing protein n=1 Tax=Solanum lycopersicum TaxID=4081 RepID=K4BYC4_SOLLC